MPVLHSSTFRGTAFLVLAAALVMALAAGAMLHAVYCEIIDGTGMSPSAKGDYTIVPHQCHAGAGIYGNR